MDLSTNVYHCLHLQSSFITASSFADTRIFSLPHRFRPNLIHHNPSSVSKADPGLSSIKSNSRKYYVQWHGQNSLGMYLKNGMGLQQISPLQEARLNSLNMLFPKLLESGRFRFLIGRLSALPLLNLTWTRTLTLKLTPLSFLSKPSSSSQLLVAKLMLQADIGFKKGLLEVVVVRITLFQQPLLALWPIGHELQQFELEYCLVNPLDRESRVRVLLLLAPNNPKLAVQRIRVFSELWHGPFRNGEQLGGCAIRESAFAATAPLKASQIVGIWQGPRAVATFDASDQSELPKQLLDGSTRKTVRDELHLLLLPKQLWCSLKDSKDGETSFEVGWVYTHGCAVTSETIFSEDAKLKEISIARETVTVEGA